ncbi:hypothetical protein CMV_019436 [Castanea mollissima]|uniref:Exostosin GT47 domain-containing protein n=1 Tax=Castanea mollissima TaxID=60419 RepID=A0A8J4R319_9ROSI|nr:hypothetical protein CMV_019436 [Castanea mollissima]
MTLIPNLWLDENSYFRVSNLVIALCPFRLGMLFCFMMWVWISITFYQTPRKLTSKYASEGYFFQNIRESRFRTSDPDQAHLFFIPISCHKMRGKGTSYENMTIIVQNYVESLISKYPYWNRTLGADHFFVTCHDVGVRATEGFPLLVKNSIRVVCSPSYDVGFIPHKDVALPQVCSHLLSQLEEMILKIGQNLDFGLDIGTRKLDTKFSICPGGSQVNSARIADSIHYGCVPGSEAFPVELSPQQIRCIPYGHVRALVVPPCYQILIYPQFQ